jgi:hypothetical protein
MRPLPRTALHIFGNFVPYLPPAADAAVFPTTCQSPILARARTFESQGSRVKGRESRVESQESETESFDSKFAAYSVANPLRLCASARDVLRRWPKILVVFVPRPVVGKSRVESRESRVERQVLEPKGEGGRRKGKREWLAAVGDSRGVHPQPDSQQMTDKMRQIAAGFWRLRGVANTEIRAVAGAVHRHNERVLSKKTGTPAAETNCKWWPYNELTATAGRPTATELEKPRALRGIVAKSRPARRQNQRQGRGQLNSPMSAV